MLPDSMYKSSFFDIYPIKSGINQNEDQKRFANNQDIIPMGVVKISFNCSFITFLFIR